MTELTLEQMSYTALPRQRPDPLFTQQSPRIMRRKQFSIPLALASSKKLMPVSNEDAAAQLQEQFCQGLLFLTDSPHKASQFPTSRQPPESVDAQVRPKPKLPEEFKYKRTRPRRLEFQRVSVLLGVKARAIAREPSASVDKVSLRALQLSTCSVKNREQVRKEVKAFTFHRPVRKQRTRPRRDTSPRVSSAKPRPRRLQLTCTPKKPDSQFLSSSLLIQSFA